MKAFRQFALIYTICLSLIAPAMACAIPSAHLTSAERACCRQMKTQCGNMNMPASHGCCHKDLPTSGYLSAIPTSITHNAALQVVASGVLPVIQFPDLVVAREPVSRHESALPQSPPASISILRI